MTWFVNFRGGADEVNASFDERVERLRLNTLSPVGEFEDLHQARTLVLAAIDQYGCGVIGSARGHWVGVDFKSFALTIDRYVPSPDVQLPLSTPTLVDRPC